MSLANLQQLFQTFILEDKLDIEKHIANPALGNVKDRLSVYGDGYVARLEEVLADDFSALLALLGEDKFYKLTYRYIITHPSIYFSINSYGEKFPEFLNDIEAHYAEMAAFEWAEGYAITAADARVWSLGDIQKTPIENWPLLTFRLHPSLQLVTQRWNSLAIIQSLRVRKKAPKAKLLIDPITIIIWRKDLEVKYSTLELIETKLLIAIQNKKNFAEICELLCEDLPENEVAEYAVNKILICLERGLLVDAS